MTVMGWCQEFGVQVKGGCDHVMVASLDSCSCAECGVICRGKFPGCATVWAAGPVEVALRRPTKALKVEPPVPTSGPTNGKTTHSSEIAPRHVAAPAANRLSADVIALVQSLRAEIQVLNSRIELVQDRADASVEAANAANQALADLPPKLGKAVSAALQQQRGAILNDLAALRKQLSADLGQPAGKERPPSDGSIQAVTVAQLDARFEWLVNELSDRLVVLGNEVARINQGLAPQGEAGLPSHLPVN
jgi:hypothetical protein